MSWKGISPKDLEGGRWGLGTPPNPREGIWWLSSHLFPCGKHVIILSTRLELYILDKIFEYSCTDAARNSCLPRLDRFNWTRSTYIRTFAALSFKVKVLQFRNRNRSFLTYYTIKSECICLRSKPKIWFL